LASDPWREEPTCLSFDDAEKKGWEFQYVRRGETPERYVIKNAAQLWDAMDRAEQLVARRKQSYYLMSPPRRYGLSPSHPAALSFLLETRTCPDLCLGYALLPQPSALVAQPFLYRKHIAVDPSDPILFPFSLDLSPYSFVFFSGDWDAVRISKGGVRSASGFDEKSGMLTDEALKFLNRNHHLITFRDVWLLTAPQSPLSTDWGNRRDLEKAHYTYSTFVGGLVPDGERYGFIRRCLNGG
jgi:hypothetical protein